MKRFGTTFASMALLIAPFEGRWLSEDGEAVFEMAKCPQGLCGTIVGVKKQPDSSCGMTLLTLTKWVEAKKRWEGEVLDPDTNKKYAAELEVGKDGAPVMRASWGLLKFADRWKKFAGSIGKNCEMKP